MPTWTAASNRFSATALDSKHNWSTHPTTVYTCPSCHAETEFALRDFDQHSRSKEAVLATTDDAELFATLPEVMRDWGNSLLAFHCSRCAARVLVLYGAADSHVNGRCYSMSWVIEAAAA